MKHILVILAFVLAGCGTKPSSRVTVVRFWHAMGGESARSLKALCDEFEQANPGVRIELVGMGSYDALAQKLMGAVAAKNPPTIAQMYESWTTQLHAAEQLEYLEDFVRGPDGLSDDDIADIYPALLANNTWDGKLLTLPFNKSVPVYYYNADVLSAAGYDSFPATWPEFGEMCRKVMRRGAAGEVQMWATANGTDIWIFGSMLYQRGGRYLDHEDGRPEFNLPVAVAALQFQLDLVRRDSVQSTDTGREPMDDFLVQRTATLTGSSTWRAPAVDKETFRVGMAPLPRWEKPAAIVYGTNIGMFRRARDAEKAAAWRFIRWFISPEQQVKWSLGTWYVPIHRRCLDDPRIAERLEKTPGLRRAYAQMDCAVFEPRGLKWLAGRKALVEELEAATLGAKSAQQALDDAARRYLAGGNQAGR